ncbi:MAG: VOC family protein [Nitrospirae bacterium]|nr:VOC family protein [Nitrospirota bacterium]
MKILEFAFVAYPVTDINRARSFYEGVLGFTRKPTATDSEQVWFEYEVGPHTLGIGMSPNWKPSSDGPSLALEVDDFDDTMVHLRRHHASRLLKNLHLLRCQSVLRAHVRASTLRAQDISPPCIWRFLNSRQALPRFSASCS